MSFIQILISKTIGDNLGYTFAQVPHHKSKKFVFPFLLGKIPEWRSHYSSNGLIIR